MLIHAARRRRTAHSDSVAEAIEWTVDAPDYETGKAQIDATVSDDEVLLYVRPER